MQFLTKLFEDNLGYNTLNTARSALSSILTIDSKPVGSHPLICRYMKGVLELRPPVPRYCETWDVNDILQFFTKQDENENLSLALLTKKVTTLLLLLSGQRVQTAHQLKLSQIMFKNDKCEIRITGSNSDKSKHFNRTKNVQSIEFEKINDSKLCVVKCIQDYIKRTEGHRKFDNFLLCCIKPFRPASKDTVTRWLKDVMKLSGIDTGIFAAHSIRGASTSKALKLDVPLETILENAGWSNAQTFKKFYFRDVCESNEKKTARSCFGNSILKYFKEK